LILSINPVQSEFETTLLLIDMYAVYIKLKKEQDLKDGEIKPSQGVDDE